MLESSKISVEHARYVGKIFETRANSRAFATAGSAMTSGLTLNRCSFSKNSLKRRKKIDYPRSLGCGGLKGLTRSGQSLFFSLVKKTKVGTACSGSTYLAPQIHRMQDLKITLTWPWLFPMKNKRRQKNN